MTVETRQLQVVTEGSPPMTFDIPASWEFRVVCDNCGTASPWQSGDFGDPSNTPPAWFMSHTGENQTAHICGYCAGGGGKVPVPRKDTIWWSNTKPRSVGRVVTTDPLGSVSVSVIYTPNTPPSDKRLRPLSGSILLPVRDFYSAWGCPKPDDDILSPRTVWLNFSNGETVTLNGAEYLGPNNYLVCIGEERVSFQDFVLTHVPTGAKTPRTRYERLLEEDSLG